MAFLRKNYVKELCQFVKTQRFNSTATSVSVINEKYTSVPNYPPIQGVTYDDKLQRKKEAKYEEIKAVKTVEEKQIKLNMPRYYGFARHVFKEHNVKYNSLECIQHITRTHLKQQEELPQFYERINVDLMVNHVKEHIEEAILYEFIGLKRNNLSNEELERRLSLQVVCQINRILLNYLAQDYNHMYDIQVDVTPRIEAFWFAGGMNPSDNVRRTRDCRPWLKHLKETPADRGIYYTGKPLLTLRNELPLKPILNESECQGLEVPYFKYDPHTVGVTKEFGRIVNTPGFWPGDKATFGLLSYHSREYFINRYKVIHENDKQDVLNAQGIMAAFSWLFAQANYLGFTTYNDITYPLVTQAVITNGQIYSFYTYQLNTVLVHGTNTSDNPKVNVMYASPEMKLFEEINDGKLIGFNTDTLKFLLKYYSNVPEARLGLNMTPYLSQAEKVSADYDDDDKRTWLEREYKFLTSERNRYKLDPEVYHWEKIYKIDHNTRPMDARRRPFELHTDPYERKLNERQANYIPRCLRPDKKRWDGRYAKEYFP